MQHLKFRVLVLLVLVGFLLSANMSQPVQSAPVNCNWFCYRDCEDQFHACMNNNPYYICCGEFNQCIQSCGTSCFQCEQEPPPE
jgi:hypothetical protein